jgi:hypothetical protein
LILEKDMRRSILKNEMNSIPAKYLLYISDNQNPNLGKLEKNIQSIIPIKYLEEYKTLKELSERLHEPPTYNLGIAFLIVQSEKELIELLSMKVLFENIRIILFIDTKSDTSISFGRLLNPRLLIDKDTNPEIIKEILGKMIKHYKLSILKGGGK